MTSTTAGPTLPVWPTVRQAFGSVVLANWQAVLRIFGAWVAVLIGIFLLLFRMFPARTGGPPRAGLNFEWRTGQTIIEVPFSVFLLVMAVTVFAVASTAVAWHRLLLLGEQPPLINLRVGGPVLRYAGRLLLIVLIAILMQLACALILYYLFYRPAPMRIQGLPALIFSLPTIMVASRIALSLPAIAVERPIGLVGAWQLTRGNALHLCGGILLIYAPGYMLALAMQGFPADRLAYFGLAPLVGFFCYIAALSFLSLCYRFFTTHDQPAQTQSGARGDC